MAYSTSTTIGEIFDISKKVMNNHDVFKLGKRSLAKIFIRELLELNTEASDEELQLAYNACSPLEKIPKNTEDFWTFVEREYLYLETEPKTKFFELALRVHEDLAALAKNLAYIQNESKSLEEKKKNNGRLTADERYYKNQLEYFEKKNLVAKDQIVEFMAYKIKAHAITKASIQRPINPFLKTTIFGDSPYPFGRRLHWVPADPYDVRALDQYSNKFMDLPITTYRNLIKECKKSPEAFKKNAIAYIQGIPNETPSVRDKIESLVNSSHILFNRKQVISTMLRHFEMKDYISFVSMAPLQIEGIFADICRSIGISESQLDISSLNDKLQHIDERMRSFFPFEYYSFKFPVLRNLVAHGGLVDGELEDTAIHLILDLLPVCELAISDDLPIMRALDVLKEAHKGNNAKLVEWVDLRNSVDIPAFYKYQKIITEVELQYTTQTFWDYLVNELKTIKEANQIKQCKPIKIAGKLKMSEIAVEQAKIFLKSAERIAIEAIKQRKETWEKFNSALKSGKDTYG